MTDVDRLILEAWEKLGRGIMGDAEELQKRLARRRRAVLLRPPRAWCVCLRASDRRITPMDWILTPMHAMDLNHPEHPYEPIEHEVTIQPHGLRKFCRAVRTEWGALVTDVARQLGVKPCGLHRARLGGLFHERFVKGLGGKRGRPIPMIHTWTALDPSGVNFARPDPLWGGLWEYLAEMIPEDFEQTVMRRPKFQGLSGKDACPTGEVYRDEMKFRGWRWVCPGCKKEVGKIYYPLPVRTLFDFLGYDPGTGARRAAPAPKRAVRYDVERVEAPPGTFACFRCHGVRGTERTSDNGWNQIVSHLTRGMLYGHEVAKPHWYRIERKRTRVRQVNRSSPKRDAIFETLKIGRTVDEIALEMLISRKAVKRAVQIICRQEGVKDRRGLAKKLGWGEPPLNRREQREARVRARDGKIEGLLLEGLEYREIARKLGMEEREVYGGARRIYARYGVSGKDARRNLARKQGVVLGGKCGVEREIRERLLAGQKYGEIVEAMGMSYSAVSQRCEKIYAEEGVKGRRGLMEKHGRDSELRSQNSEVASLK